MQFLPYVTAYGQAPWCDRKFASNEKLANYVGLESGKMLVVLSLSKREY